ncbi:hypothetical protein C8Q80DRAFT_217860 [Daedaleopsis nitida]|nr:hypothetical protein C8Q80DRAFT_217860 [Daedaleopsis nitida]
MLQVHDVWHPSRPGPLLQAAATCRSTPLQFGCSGHKMGSILQSRGRHPPRHTASMSSSAHQLDDVVEQLAHVDLSSQDDVAKFPVQFREECIVSMLSDIPGLVDLGGQPEERQQMPSRKFSCEQCDRVFSCRRNLNAHTRSVHDGMVHRGNKCNICPQWSRAYARRQDLKRYMEKAHPDLREHDLGRGL